MIVQRFHLDRVIDETGVSGTGIVARGFRLGPCAFMRWHTRYWTICFYPKWQWLEPLHGHQGKTRIVWRGPAPA
jgi:hypothetical protein